MSFTQTAIGGAFLAGLATLAIQTIAPAPKPIVVHSLTYKDGVVYQDRTVRSNGPVLYASWTAKVIDAETGDALPNCSGGGVWPYPVGRKEYAIPLAEWVGNDKCTPDTIKGHHVKFVAAWQSNNGDTSKESAPYRP